MTLDPDRPTRVRVSLTKTQRESEIGAELLSLCQTITADGALTPDEVSALRTWLEEHKDENLPAISHLIPTVESILADGQVTNEESRALFIAVEAVLPPDVRTIAKNARRTVEQREKDRVRLERELAKAQTREVRERNAPLEKWDFMVSGVRFEGRPAVIARHVRPSEPARLVRDPGNRYSKHAIQVQTQSGHQIGFVPEEHAIELSPFLDAGNPCRAHIKKVLYGGRYPMPVIVAEVFRKDSDNAGPIQVEDAVTKGYGSKTKASGVRSLGVFAVIAVILVVLFAWLRSL